MPESSVTITGIVDHVPGITGHVGPEYSLSLAQIAGQPRATAHRMLSAFKEIGFIEQDGRSGGYSLGTA